MRGAADHQAGRVDAPRVEPVDLVEEHAEVDHHAVADHRRAARRQDPGRQQVQRVLLTVDDDRVPGVVAAVELDHRVDPAAEQVGRLALAFVAPLGADENDRGHGSPHHVDLRLLRLLGPEQGRRRCDQPPRAAAAAGSQSVRKVRHRCASSSSPISAGRAGEGVQGAQESAVGLVRPRDRAVTLASPPGAARPARGGSRCGRRRSPRRCGRRRGRLGEGGPGLRGGGEPRGDRGGSSPAASGSPAGSCGSRVGGVSRLPCGLEVTSPILSAPAAGRARRRRA